MRQYTPLVLAILILLAGCSGTPGDGSTATPSTTTPEQTSPGATTTTATTASPAPATFPPGLTADGVTDPSALAETHQKQLRNSSYTVEHALTVQYENGTTALRYAYDARVAAGGAPLVANETATNLYIRTPRQRLANGTTRGGLVLAEQVETWSAQNRTLVAITRSNEATTYVSDRFWKEPATRHEWAGRTAEIQFYLDVLVEANSTTVSEISDGGATFYEVTSPGLEKPLDREFEIRDRTLYNLTREQIRLQIAPHGVVHSFTSHGQATYNGQPVTVTHSFRVTNVGNTTVTKPAWYDEARNATAE